MKPLLPRAKSAALHRHAAEIYGEKSFEEFQVDIGIVATHLEYNRPTIFKRMATQAHGSSGSFSPGFGCKIAGAVIASCAAYPIFKKKHISTTDHGERSVVDGGFSANNPTLFALTDALGPLNVDKKDIRLLSIGAGSYPARWRLVPQLLGLISPTKTIKTLLATSSNTVETLRGLLFADIETLRIDDAYTEAAYKTDFIESRESMLKEIFQLGRRSFEKHEAGLGRFFGA